MVDRMVSCLARFRFTLGYLAALAAVSIAAVVIEPQRRAELIQRASTNLHNLARGHLDTLLGSAFVVEAGPIYFWMPFLACLLALAELQLSTFRLVVAFAIGHIGATLVVAAVLAAAVTVGWIPPSITRASDVGMSYGALAALGALTATIPRPWRPAWIGWWLSLAAVAVCLEGGFTNVGHTVAIILGVLVSTRFREPITWNPVRLVMLVMSVGFGFLILAHHWYVMIPGALIAALGAAFATAVDRAVTWLRTG